MNHAQNQPHGTHNAILENRERLLLSGVTEIDSFDDRTVCLYTQLGEMTILGKKLHMDAMSIESGEVAVTGEIHAIRYGDADKQKPLGHFGKLFR